MQVETRIETNRQQVCLVTRIILRTGGLDTFRDASTSLSLRSARRDYLTTDNDQIKENMMRYLTSDSRYNSMIYNRVGHIP